MQRKNVFCYVADYLTNSEGGTILQVKIPDSLLLSVQKPARYIGGEVNTIHKDLSQIDTHFCFCFPDVYDVGMCHMGLQILYHDINQYEGVYCERCFAPWTDMEAAMRKNQIPLYSLETFTPLKEYTPKEIKYPI